MKKRFLRREVRRWLDEGLVSPTQATRILARYDTSLSVAEPSSFRWLSAIAALLAGLALLLVVSAHWQQLPQMMRLAGLVLLTLVLNLIAVRRLYDQRGGLLLLFLGGLAYGASIMLIGQMYHLGESYGAGFFLWALGTMPLAVLAGASGLALQSLLAALVWAWQVAPLSIPWALPVFLAPAFVVAHRRQSTGLLLAALAVTGLWLNLLLSWAYATDFGPRWRVGLYPFDLALLLLAVALMRFRFIGAMRGSARTVLICLSLPILLPFTFSGAWHSYLAENWGWFDPGLWATLLTLLIVLVPGRWSHRATAFGLALTLIAVHGWGRPEWAVPAAIAGNLVLVATALLWLRRGLTENRGALFFSGLAGILIVAVLRYLDLLGSYLAGAGLLLAMAIIVWGAAYYWRAREART